jgi:hemerythrin-like domain-containing protein
MRRLLKKLACIILVLLLALAFFGPDAHAESKPEITLTSQYIIGRYGFGVINETVSFHNNSTSPIPLPSFRIGITQDIGKLVSYFNATSGFEVLNSANMSTYQVNPRGKVLQPNSTLTFALKLFMPSIVYSKNNSIYIYLLLSPSFNLSVSSSKLVIKMPASTQLVNAPHGYGYTTTGTNTTYFKMDKNIKSLVANSTVTQIQTSSAMDFHPLRVFSASRSFSFSSSGQIIVTDSITFRNEGVTTLSTLTVSPLTSANSKVTVVASSQPPLLNPVSVSLSGYGIQLSASGLNSPVASGTNYTISYSYTLDQKYYTTSGNTVILDVPLTPPIPTSVDSYTITVQGQPGVRLVSGQTFTGKNLNIFSSGKVSFKLGVTIAWTADYFVPLASLLFFALLLGFITVRGESKEEKKEEPVERVSAMIKAFEEKNSIVVDAIEEMKEKKEGKTYFDEIRSRIEGLRTKALQRLNEAKQVAVSQDILEVLNMIQNTEREADRAARDLINLYEQHYTNKVSRETFERLLPSYKKRLDRSLNALSDLLNEAQRESKQA